MSSTKGSKELRWTPDPGKEHRKRKSKNSKKTRWKPKTNFLEIKGKDRGTRRKTRQSPRRTVEVPTCTTDDREGVKFSYNKAQKVWKDIYNPICSKDFHLFCIVSELLKPISEKQHKRSKVFHLLKQSNIWKTLSSPKVKEQRLFSSVNRLMIFTENFYQGTP